jgi:hypothetical protein
MRPSSRRYWGFVGLRRFARLGDAYRFVLEADLTINCPAYACRQLGRNVEAGKRQAASNATRRRSIEDPAWIPDGAESLFALVTPARFRILGRLFDPSPKFTGGRGSEFR